jgi:cytochrome d ubiquinol oxidase subunit II
VTGFAEGPQYLLFAAAIMLTLPAAYVLHGAAWLVMKTEGDLQRHAAHWGRVVWPAVVAGIALVSVATPWVSPAVRAKWFVLPEFIALLPIPMATATALLVIRALLKSRHAFGSLCWLPFGLMIAVFLLGALGLAYSLYPDVVIGRLTLWQAASATESLAFIAVGCAITVPAIAAYTLFSYRVFSGKARELTYG